MRLSHLMFLRGLNSFSSSLHPRGPPARCWTNIRSSAAFSSSNPPRFIRASPPWWPVYGLPAWPPPLSHPHPSAHQFITGRTFQPLNLSSGSWCSLHTSAGRMMERPEREPPNKRWRSEEKKGGHIGASSETRGKVGESRRDYSLQPKPHFKSEDLEKTKSAGERSASREKDAEKTKSEKKGRRDDSPNQHAHPAGPRTQTPKSKPEPDLVPEHKPNPWFKGRAAEELGAPQRSKTGPREQLKDGRGDEAQWPGLWSKSSSTGQSPNPRQATWAHRPSPSHELSRPVKPLQRFWESCSTEPRPPGDSTLFDFSVMSYNILSQELLQDNAYLYGHCEPSVLPWDYRLPNLLTEILQLNADILCLQEVQEDHYENQIKPALQARGYQCEYKKRTGQKPDGCAVAFKTSRFSLVSSTPVEFFRPGDGLLDRDNVGLVVLLQPNNGTSQSNSSSICVANTHLLYNPRRGDIKLAQLAILLAEISRLSRLPDGSTNPVVLCGDLNSVPWSPLYRFLTTGRLEYRGMQIGMVSGQETSPRGHRPLTSPIWSSSLGISDQCQYESKVPDESSSSSPTGGISNLTVEDLTHKSSAAVKSSRIEHSLKLRSSYEHRLMPDGRPEITTCHSRTALTVDYILYSSALAMPPSLPGGRGLQLLGRLSLVGQSELEEVNNLPNQHHSSDHLPLLTSFRLRF